MAKLRIEEIVAQKAVEQTGFGKFNLKITAFGALIYFNCALCITSTGFVVPAAACDFEMTTIDKGRISAAPMLGMLVGSGIWSYAADLKGRKFALIVSLCIQCLLDLLASVVTNYWAFVFLKLVSGVGITGQLSVMFPYIGEFQPTKYRNQILSWMELFWAVGVAILPFFAWAVIPLQFQYKTDIISFSSWNLFILTCALPAFFIMLWLLTLPETPKYLAESGQEEKLLKVLTRMYVENTGKTAAEFEEKLANLSVPSISALVIKPDNEVSQKRLSKRMSLTKREKFDQMIESSKLQVQTLAKKPYLKRVCMTSMVMFCMTSTYYSLMTWFPELFQRFAAFEAEFPDGSASVCTVSKPTNMSEIITDEDYVEVNPYGCGVPIDPSVYINSAFLGLACIPGAVVLPLTVDKLGYRIFIVFSAVVSCGVTIGLLFVKTSFQNLILSCIFEAFTSLSISVIFCLLVEIFPTNLRVMAAAITIFVGRAGSLFGNMLFSFLIDEHCLSLITIMALQLFVAALMSWSTPGRNKMKKIQNIC